MRFVQFLFFRHALEPFFLIINSGTDITYYLKRLSFCQKICFNIINLSLQIIFLFMA